MLWAEEMWTPMSHLLARSQCWLGTGCKLCPNLASLLLFAVRDIWDGEVFISAAWEKGLLNTLSGCKQSRATLAKAEEEMGTACAVFWELRSVRGIQWGWSPGWAALLEQNRRLSSGQGDGQWCGWVWKRAGKEVLVRRGLQFLF